MLFERLANWVIKHYKKIIVFWIVVLLPSVYGLLHVGEVIVYNEIGTGPTNTEAEHASNIINDQFPNAIANSTVIIVLQANDVQSTAIRDFSSGIEKRVNDDTNAGKIDGQAQYTSIYTVYDQALTTVVNTTNKNLRSAESNVNQTTSLFYGMPANFLTVHNYTNYTASLIYGIPKLHKNTWDSLSSVTNTTERDRQAYVDTYNDLVLFFGMGTFPKSGAGMLFDYYNLTCEKWNNTRNDPIYNMNSTLRAQKSIDDEVPDYVDKYFSSPPEAKQLLYSIWKNWTVTTWYIEMLEPGKSNLPSLNEFANKTIYNNMISMMVAGSASMPLSQEVPFLEYHNITMRYWDNATKNYTSASALTPSNMKLIMEHGLNTNAPPFINRTFANDPTQKGFTFSIIQNFSMDNWNDSTKIHSFTMDLLEINFHENGINFADSQFEEIYNMGDNPKDSVFETYAHNIVYNGTLDTYPLQLPQIITGNFISPNKDTMLIIITFTQSTENNVDQIRSIVSDLKKTSQLNGTTTYVTGDTAIGADLSIEAFGDVEKIDPVTIGLIIALITIFFMSVVTPFIPLMIMGLGIVISESILFLVGKLVAGIHYSVTILLVVVLFGAGCDYCIFIIARYREERREGRSTKDSVRTSLTWAGESIATSGITVMLGFGALAIGRFSLMRTMGLVLAMSIGIALLIALTLLPSILLLLGDRIFWPSTNMKKKTWLDSKISNGTKKQGVAHRGYFSNAARFSIKHAKAIVIAAIIIAVPTTYAVLNFQSSFDFIASMPKTESTDGMKAMGSGFGEGTIMPTYITIQFPYKIYDGNKFNTTALNSIDSFSQKIMTNINGIAKIQPSTNSSGTRIDKTDWSTYTPQEKNRTVMQSVGRNNQTVLLTITFKAEPLSKGTMDTIDTLRAFINNEKKITPGFSNTVILVGGSTADLKDTQAITDVDFHNMIIIVIIGIFIVLLLVLGSVLIPLRLILTISLSISWTLAITMVIFEDIRGMPLLWLLPMILFVVMMGLGMDYDIFLCTRIREEVTKGSSDVKAIVTSVERTGGIITACGAIMAGALGSMMLSSMGLLQQFGFALFFAILIDATIVRIYLVPAIMVLLTKWNWWAPGPLQRVERDRKKLEAQKNLTTKPRKPLRPKE